MLAPGNANLGMNANGGQEPEWKERLRRWKLSQLSQRAVTDMTDKELETLKNCTFSVLGCLQAEFKCQELQEAVEQSLVSGLRRASGLKLLKKALEISNTSTQDLIQWFQGSLRDNKMTGNAHYLTGLEGCSSAIRKGL